MIPTVIRVFLQIFRNPLNAILSLFTTPLILGLFQLVKQFSSIENDIPFPDLQLFFPKLLVLSLVMSIFPMAMAITEESESNCTFHLRLAGLKTWEIHLGMAIPYYFLGLSSSIISLLFGLLLGIEIYNLPIILIGIVCGLISLIGIGLMIGSLAKNTLQSFFISSLIMFLMLVFSGVLFPIPSIELMNIYQHRVDLFFFLPTSSIQGLIGKSFHFEGSTIFRDSISHTIELLILGVVYIYLGILIYERNESQFLENSL